MISLKILSMQLVSIQKSISSYTSEPNISENTKMALESFDKGDFETFNYCCNYIAVWYSDNINKIRSNQYVSHQDGHTTSKKNIENIVFDINQNKEEYENAFVKIYKSVVSEGKSLVLDSKKAFLVHGRDNGAKNEVARFLERIDIEPIILHEQASYGKTIIEKIESYTDVGYAIIIYTPCDIGKLDNKTSEFKNRARQNVVFEHGYIVGKIGRNRVSALVKGNIELPTDIDGVVYTQMDESGAWRISIAKEMKAVDYFIDMNNL